MLPADPPVSHSHSPATVEPWGHMAGGQSPRGNACRNVKVPPPQPHPKGNGGKTQNAADTPATAAAYLL